MVTTSHFYTNANIDVSRLILTLRPDLYRRFDNDKLDNTEGLLEWLITSGVKEYAVLGQDHKFAQYLAQPDPMLALTRLQATIYRVRPDVRLVFDLPKHRDQFIQWFRIHGVGEHDLYKLLLPDEIEATLQVAQQECSPWMDKLREEFSRSNFKKQSKYKSRPFGVNLIGYAFGQLGIGEDLRMTAHALKAAGIPFVIVNFSPGKDIPQNDRSLQKWVLPEGNSGPYAINLFCMTALETGRFYAERGGEQLDGRYNIGYWPWELSKWPEPWQLIHPLVDEVWVSTLHIHDALRPSYDGPIRVMPLVVAQERGSQQLLEPTQRDATRHKHLLPLRALLFCFSFDLNSSMHRKNPQACIEAFLKAFPRGELTRRRVGLVIKTHIPKSCNREWKQLKSLAALDDRIHIIEGTLIRRDLMALYAACDCFVSLHRAEGFGRGLAEALQLGLHLIATDYSGNTDFCHRPEFSGQISLIPYRLVKVRDGQYPYATAQQWASPNVAAAALAMRACQQAKSMSSQVPRGGWPCFNAKILGKLYAQRLQNIYKNQST